MKLLSAALILLASAAPLAASAGERLFLQIPVMIDPSAPIPAAVKNECALEMLLENYALSAINQRMGPVQSISAPEQAGTDKIVKLTIISAHGFGGGGWSGPKSASIRVDVSKEGVIVGSTVLTRASKRGGMFGGTCAVFDRVAGALGKDAAVWLSRESAVQSAQSASKAAESLDEPESPATE